MQKKIFICFFYILFFSSSIFAFDYDYDSGLLWQIEAPNGKKSQLFGTMHLVDKDMNTVFDLISYQIKQSRMVFIEYTLEQTDALFISEHLVHTKAAISTKLSNQELGKLKKFFQENHIPFDSLKNASPSLIYSYLINPGSISDLQIDFKIADFAHKQKIPVKGLENARDVFEKMLAFDNKFYIFALKNRLSQINTLPSYRKRLKILYFKEDLPGLLFSVHEKNISPEINQAFMNTLINQRNIHMFNRTRKELDKGQVFIAVGAAHLGGEKGLISLLKNAGYKMTRQDLSLSLTPMGTEISPVIKIT